ncbi:MAG: hypothetical protein WBV22_06335 [Anaerolineaceae bacterium]
MSGNLQKQIVKSTGGGFFQDIGTRIKLIIRLMRDRRVSFFLKLLPIGTLVYLVVPDLIPFVIDDALVIWLGTYLFVELSPESVVDEHMTALQKRIPAGSDTKPPEEPTVVEGEYKDINDQS